MSTGYSSSRRSPCCWCVLADTRHLPHGRSRAGDRHLKFYETRDNLCRPRTPFNALDRGYSQPRPESPALRRPGLDPAWCGELADR